MVFNSAISSNQMILILFFLWSKFAYAVDEIFGILDLSGTIQSPGYPVQYSNNLKYRYDVRCLFIIY
jgi:hypothetical protein